MMNSKAMPAAADDSELIQASLTGNRDAFGQIVIRHQSLICSLAYSATGSLSQSEDLAQETFVTAWKNLGKLHEPYQLRGWLCGIARNLISNARRRQHHEPSHAAETLEDITEPPAIEPLPCDHAIANEEAALLWRSLARIPDIYREPLVLFYREHQSVENVARQLDLTEDAVRQRLTRGRKLLQEQVLVFVEGALERTGPGSAFTAATLASLPGLTLSAKTATVIATAQSASAKGAGLLGMLALMLGPLVVFVPNYLVYRASLAGAESDTERQHIRSFFARVGLVTLGLFLPVVAISLWLSRDLPNRSFLTGVFAMALVVIYLPTMLLFSFASARQRHSNLQTLLDQKHAGNFPRPIWEYCSKAEVLGLPLIHWRIGDRFSPMKPPVKAWFAIGDRAIGGAFAFGGLAIAPISIGGLAAGIVSFGGLGLGIITLGGIALGVWPLFGGLLLGWQSFCGGCTIAWHSAVGNLALAHDYALGRFAWANEANNEVARRIIEPNPFFHAAQFISRHWYYLILLCLGPILIQWWTAIRQQNQKSTPSSGQIPR